MEKIEITLLTEEEYQKISWLELARMDNIIVDKGHNEFILMKDRYGILMSMERNKE